MRHWEGKAKLGDIGLALIGQVRRRSTWQRVALPEADLSAVILQKPLAERRPSRIRSVWKPARPEAGFAGGPDGGHPVQVARLECGSTEEGCSTGEQPQCESGPAGNQSYRRPALQKDAWAEAMLQDGDSSREWPS